MGESDIDGDDLLNEIVAWLEPERPPGDGWFQARVVADLKGEPIERVRKRIDRKVDLGEAERFVIGRNVYYRRVNE